MGSIVSSRQIFAIADFFCVSHFTVAGFEMIRSIALGQIVRLSYIMNNRVKKLPN
jgi:hypothetical protein